MTCGDDALTKEYVAKAQVCPHYSPSFSPSRTRADPCRTTTTKGFWGDVKGYYSEPPMLLTIDHLSGNRTSLVQKIKILLMAA